MSQEGESLLRGDEADGCRGWVQGGYRQLLCTHIFETRDTSKRRTGALAFQQFECYSPGSNFAIPISRGLIDLRERILDMSATLLPLIDIGISKHIGKYSDALEVPRAARWLFTSGTPGLLPDGTLPATFELQAEQAWKNILLALQRAGMGPEHLVKIVQYLVREEDIAAYGAVRARFLGDCRPASMLLVAAALPKPGFLIEIEAIAAAPA